MQDTSHQNKQCCNKCGMRRRRIPERSCKYSRTDGKHSQNYFCHEFFLEAKITNNTACLCLAFVKV